jgi:hypothetical protein
MSLEAKPRGLSLGNNILILFQKETCAFLFILSFGKGKWEKGMQADGTHAVPRVTSVSPGACR